MIDDEAVTRAPFYRRRGVLIGIGALLGVLLLLLIDIVALSIRMTSRSVAFPKLADGIETWVIAGSDNRSSLPAGATAAQFGSTTEVPGARADIVIVITKRGNSVAVTSVPRDLTVLVKGYPQRLTFTLQKGPQGLVDALCTSLNIPADHFVQVEFSGFVDIINKLGGITVTIDDPIRDTWTGLSIAKTGEVTLNGTQALALVRSRQGELLVDGKWIPETDGADARATWGAKVMLALIKKAKSRAWNPVELQRLLWTLTGAITTDSDTGLFDLAGLRSVGGPMTELPYGATTITGPPTQAHPVEITGATKKAVTNLGYHRRCSAS